MAKHTTEDLVRLIGVDWIAMPDGTWLDPFAVFYTAPGNMTEDEDIVF